METLQGGRLDVQWIYSWGKNIIFGILVRYKRGKNEDERKKCTQIKLKAILFSLKYVELVFSLKYAH